jgi:hypothetical protein
LKHLVDPLKDAMLVVVLMMALTACVRATKSLKLTFLIKTAIRTHGRGNTLEATKSDA